MARDSILNQEQSAREPARPFIVYPILVVGLSSFAFSSILVRLASDAPGMAIAVWRTTFSVLLLAPFAAVRVSKEIRNYSWRDLGLIGAAGLLLGLHFVTWIESLYHTSVASSSVLVTTSPIFLAVFGFLFLKERLRIIVVVAVIVGVVGAALIGIGDSSGDSPPGAMYGNMLALIAAIFVSVYMILTRVARRKGTWLGFVFPLYLVVAVTILVIALFQKTPLLGYKPEFYGLCLLMSIGPQIVGHGSINYSLRYFPAALLGLLSLLEPVGASLLAYVLFGEAPRYLAIAGIVLVIVSVVLTMIPSRRSDRDFNVPAESELPASD